MNFTTNVAGKRFWGKWCFFVVLMPRKISHDPRSIALESTGHYRIAWLMARNDNPADSFVLKQLRLPTLDEEDWDHEVNAESFSKVQREATTMERLTASPRIVDMYGHCGTSIVSETMPGDVSKQIVPGSGYAKQADLDVLDHVEPANNLTAVEKLDIAIVMAESIADMHGHWGGPIVNGDIHPVQWLRSRDGSVKLNDFNNAGIPDWNLEKGEYCKLDRGVWGGIVSTIFTH